MKVAIKKVLFVSPSAYPLGGVAVWLDYLHRGLTEMGWDSVVGLVEGARHHDPECYAEWYPIEPRVNIACSTGTPYGRAQAIVDAVNTLHPDLIVSVNISDCYHAIRLLRKSGAKAPKLVVAIHGLQTDLFNDIRKNPDIVDAVVGTNRLTCAYLVHHCSVPQERVFYAQYGVVEAVSTPVRDSVLYNSKRPFRLLYSGRLEKGQKRILDLVEIVKISEKRGFPIELQIAGSGPDEELLRERLPLKMSSVTVCFLGTFQPHQMAEVYRDADALIVTSEWETGPIVIWEAMNEGLSVVSSLYTGSGREGALVHEKNSLLFPVGDVDAAVDCIERLLQNDGLRKRIQEGGFQLIRQNYCVEKSVRAWSDVLDTCRGLQVPPAPAAACRFSHRGRLDDLLGVRVAEKVRQLLHRKSFDSGGGGEWPHTASPTMDEGVMFEELRLLDRKL